jgi:hypothetical protein
MANYNVSGLQTLAELAKENVTNPTPEVTEEKPPVCETSDKGCMKRLVQAFSDCA